MMCRSLHRTAFPCRGRGGWRLRRLVLGTAGVVCAVAEASAQGRVGGRITILERDGGRTSDLANAVLYLEPLDAPARGASAVTVPIAMESRQFVPRIRVVPVGSTVEFPNHDPFRHNVFSKSGPNEFDLGLYARGEARDAVLRRPGVYPIFCNIHAKMVAFAIAVQTPWFVQAESDGRFQIDGIPHGRYRLHAWHDRGGATTVEVNVADDGRPLVLQLDARGFKSVQHTNKFGQEYTTTGRDRY
jgi:plastocyanin